MRNGVNFTSLLSTFFNASPVASQCSRLGFERQGRCYLEARPGPTWPGLPPGLRESAESSDPNEGRSRRLKSPVSWVPFHVTGGEKRAAAGIPQSVQRPPPKSVCPHSKIQAPKGKTDSPNRVPEKSDHRSLPCSPLSLLFPLSPPGGPNPRVPSKQTHTPPYNKLPLTCWGRRGSQRNLFSLKVRAHPLPRLHPEATICLSFPPPPLSLAVGRQ